MLLHALSVGREVDVWRPRTGLVHSVFGRAVNLLVDGEMWTVLAEAKSDLPFGIRVAVPDFEAIGLRGDETAHVRSGFAAVGSRLIVDCRTASRWVPACPVEFAPGLMRRLAVVARSVRGNSWSRSAEMARKVKSAMHSPATLGESLARVVGCGPGATPSGDDVLVGIFAVLTATQSGSTAAGVLRRALLPLLPTTNDVSAHLLRQAAHGLLGRNLHELVSALIGDASPEHLSDTVRRVVETGATSGADTCEGLLAFAPSYFIHQHEMAAA